MTNTVNRQSYCAPVCWIGFMIFYDKGGCCAFIMARYCIRPIVWRFSCVGPMPKRNCLASCWRRGEKHLSVAESNEKNWIRVSRTRKCTIRVCCLRQNGCSSCISSSSLAWARTDCSNSTWIKSIRHIKVLDKLERCGRCSIVSFGTSFTFNTGVFRWKWALLFQSWYWRSTTRSDEWWKYCRFSHSSWLGLFGKSRRAVKCSESHCGTLE